MKDELREIIEQLVAMIGYEAMVVTEEPGEEESQESEYVQFKVEVENPGPLIGNEGETLAALEFMANLIYFKRHQEWPKLRININDYLQRQKDRFFRLGEKTAERALTTVRAVRLYHLNPKQRRWVHMSLAADSRVETHSEDEGDNRCLVVVPVGVSVQVEEEPPLPEEEETMLVEQAEPTGIERKKKKEDGVLEIEV